MNILPRVLITFATASAFALCARAQTPAPRVAHERDALGVERSAPEAAEASAAERAQLRFEGLRFMSERDALKLLREEIKGFEGAFDYDPAGIENAVRVLKKFYAARGFLEAAFEVREETAATPKLVTLVVSEGERARLEEIRFEGGGRVPAARLAEATEKCLARLGGDETDWRDDYDEARLDYCVRDARRVLLGEGFLEAKTGEPKVEALERGLRATVRVEEGTRYRFGRVRVKGATAFLPEQVVEMMDARPGEVADAGKMAKGLSEKLWQEYADRGYFRYTYDVNPTYKVAPGRKGEGVVDLRIDIEEGKRFTVSSIEFVGDRGLKTDGELKSAFSLSKGDVFGLSRLQEGLERLRQMGVFGGYYNETAGGGSYSDIELSADDEKGLVSIRIFVGASNP